MAILQNRLQAIPDPARLPGISPCEADGWLQMDEVYAKQMALRDRLLAERRGEVYQIAERASGPAAELCEIVCDLVRTWPGFRSDRHRMTRPDGQVVETGDAPPLVTAGRLVQEDLCILQPGDAGEHVLTGAVLCFPAHWSLDDKFGQPLGRIHQPVARYDADLARRVQRMFDAIRPDGPLVRFNLLARETPDLHSPRREAEPAPPPNEARFLRQERQCLLRLPKTGAVVFTIHTIVVRAADLPLAQYQAARAILEAETPFPRRTAEP